MRNFKLLSVLLLCMAVVFTSCGTWNNTAKGTAIGAVSYTHLDVYKRQHI